MSNQTHKVEVCIVGLGPAGIGTALTLSNSNLASNVLCSDAGNHPSVRSCSDLQKKECKKENTYEIISGFGGCSLFSGKISGFPAGSKLMNILGSEKLAKVKVLEALHLFETYISLRNPAMTVNGIKNAEKLFEKLGFKYRYYDAYLYNQSDLQEAYRKYFCS